MRRRAPAWLIAALCLSAAYLAFAGAARGSPVGTIALPVQTRVSGTCSIKVPIVEVRWFREGRDGRFERITIRCNKANAPEVWLDDNFVCRAHVRAGDEESEIDLKYETADHAGTFLPPEVGDWCWIKPVADEKTSAGYAATVVF